MSSKRDIVLQINMHPNDARHVEHTLPHQIRMWGAQVDRVVVALDLHRSQAGRYRQDNYAENLRAIQRTLGAVRYEKPFDVLEVDYASRTREAVAATFFGANDIPDKAWDGGPFYSYFYGLWAAGGAYVLHMDSDMLFGGGSGTWMSEAIAELEARPELLFAAPLSGPPRPDGQLFEQKGWSTGDVRKDTHLSQAYLFPDVSTRIFLTGLPLLKSRADRMELVRPSASQRLRSHLLGNPPHALEAETLLSCNMLSRSLERLDMLGSGSGMWSLHPPYRSELFYQKLPELISRVERGDVPDAQRGHYDVHDSMIDWSHQRRMDTKLRRWKRHLKQVGHRLADAARNHGEFESAGRPTAP